MYVKWSETLFGIIAISSQGPNSRLENFGNWTFTEGINPFIVYTPFVYTPTGGGGGGGKKYLLYKDYTFVLCFIRNKWTNEYDRCANTCTL